MDETTELRPAPRRTPTGVLWLMALVMLTSSAWLAFGSPDDRQAIASKASTQLAAVAQATAAIVATGPTRPPSTLTGLAAP